MSPEIINGIFALVGGAVLYLLQRKGWLKPTPSPVPVPVLPPIPNPVPGGPIPTLPVPTSGLLGLLKLFLENPVIGPIVQHEIEKLIDAIRKRILPPEDVPPPPVV